MPPGPENVAMKPILSGFCCARAGAATSRANAAATVMMVFMSSLPVVRFDSACLDLDVVADDAHGVDRDVLVDRRSERLAGAHLEAPGMERALDAVAVEPALGQHGKGVGADIVGGKDLAIEIIERNRFVADLDSQHLAFADIGELCDGDPSSVIRHVLPHTRTAQFATAP